MHMLQGLLQAESWAWPTSVASHLMSMRAASLCKQHRTGPSGNCLDTSAFLDRAPKPVLHLPSAIAAPASDSPLEASKTGSNHLGAPAGSLLGLLQRQLQSWMAYCSQAVTPAALALALLYLTVLSFGTLMTAYLKWCGMAEAELSVYRG